MDRRSFLKIGGSAVAAGITGACGQKAQKIISYVIPPDEGINPVEGWFFNTTCGMCRAACGIKVRVVAGRAKKIEGNPEHPVNHGGVCARGQAAVQQLYHPERLTTPLLRNGAKGTNNFTKISWDKAAELLGRNFAKAKGGALYAIASDASHIQAGIMTRILKGLGSSRFHAPDISAGCMDDIPGGDTLYDISRAGCVLLLGADIFEDSASPVHYGWAYGEMRRGSSTRRGRLLYAGTRFSMTAGSADRFIPVKPGTLGILALGLALEAAKVSGIIPLKPGNPNETAWLAGPLAKDYSIERVSQRTSVPEDVIREIARDLTLHLPSLVIPGLDLALHSNGREAFKAVEVLNALLSEIARRNRIREIPPRRAWDDAVYTEMRKFLGTPSRAESYGGLRETLTRASGDGMAMGVILHANPAHGLPAGMGVTKGLTQTGFVANFSLFLNETTAYSDLVIPDRHFLESWSASAAFSPEGRPVFNTQQPVVNPLYAIKPSGDLLLEAAGKAGLSIQATSQEALVKAMIAGLRRRFTDIPKTWDSKKAWEHLLQGGGWWPKAAGKDGRRERVETPEAIKDPAFEGGREYATHLHPYATVHIADGAAANLPWIMEMPEPMTSVSYNSWVEINPGTAGKLGVSNGDILRLESPFGAMESPAVIYPGLGPDTVAAPIGYGHKTYGKTASGRGGNVMDLIGDSRVAGTTAPAWRGIKVRIARTGRRVPLVRESAGGGDYEGEVFQL